MTTATWAIDRGFETISASNFQAAPDDAVWEPRRRGTTVQFLIPPFSIGLVGGLLAGVAGDSWADAVLGGFGFAVLLSCGFLALAFWNVRYVGARRCIFTSEWVGVECRHEINLVPYSKIRTMWTDGGTAFAAWQRSTSGQIRFARKDGMPVRLPRLLTYTRGDRVTFFEFVYSEAKRRSLPIQDR